MRSIIVCLFLFFTNVVFAQSKLVVYSAGDRNPVANASVFCNGKLLGKTDQKGTVVFRTRCKNVEVKAPNYYDDEVLVDKVMEITLEKSDPKVGNIEKVVLSSKSDPRALAILQKVNDRYKDNSPQSLESYSFKSYEKISFDMDKDTISDYNTFIKKRMDSLATLPQKNKSKKEKKDSIEADSFIKLMGQSKMFLWEKAQEFLFSKKYGEKINVLDNRVSGLKQPIYEMLTLRSNRMKMPREIQEQNRSLYRFFLTDTIEIEGRENYVIRFRQVNYRETRNKRKFNGYLYVDAETYGLKKIESHSNDKNMGSLTSIWIPINNKWFLQKESMKMLAGNVAFKEKDLPTNAEQNDKNDNKSFGYYVYRTADYFDYKTPIEEKAKDFRGYTMEVKNTTGTLLDKYRTQMLTEREVATYEKIDSLGTKYKLTTKAEFVAGLIKGRIRIGNVDFNAGQLVKYNLYEGLRLGIGAKLNEKFNKTISPDGYIAYGFKDTKIKYGLGLDWRTTLRKNSFFRLEYYDDVTSAGRFNENIWNFRMKIMNAGVEMKNDKFYSFKGFRFSYENDLLNSLTLRVSTFRNQEEALFNYSYKNLGKSFINSGAKITLKYAPGSKNIMTPSGKYTFEQSLPEVYFNFEKSTNIFGGEFNYSKLDVFYTHQFKTKLGVTGTRVYAGLLSGGAPIWNYFQMNGLGAGKNQMNFNLTSYLGFATMEAGKYYSDRFSGYYITHRIPWYFKSFGQNVSSFDVVYRGIIGDIKNLDVHNFQFQKMDRLYQEAGLEWNNFLSSRFNLGFFYRIGYYQTTKFNENFAVQFKFKFLGF
ncbi:MAG: hypothetical protein Q4G16_11015 [Cruoricaptor ignavus]|nr:hypothetical protein [Cruoricaptor ignavus]